MQVVDHIIKRHDTRLLLGAFRALMPEIKDQVPSKELFIEWCDKILLVDSASEEMLDKSPLSLEEAKAAAQAVKQRIV